MGMSFVMLWGPTSGTCHVHPRILLPQKSQTSPIMSGAGNLGYLEIDEIFHLAP